MPTATSVRDAIWDALAAPGHSWDGRIFSPDSVELGDRSAPPFLTIMEGPEDPGTVWGGRAVMFYIAVYSAEGSGSGALDELRDEVVGVLDQTGVDTASESFTVAYDGVAGQDVVDNDWRLPTRLLRFWAAPARDRLDDESEPLPTLRSFTSNALPNVQTTRATADPSDASPFVYWRRGRLTNVNYTYANGGRILVEYEYHAHIVAPGRAVRRDLTKALAEALLTVDRWFLRMADGQIIRFVNVAADSEADPRRVAQVTLRAENEIERLLPPAEQNIDFTNLEDQVADGTIVPIVVAPGVTVPPGYPGAPAFSWPGFRVIVR